MQQIIEFMGNHPLLIAAFFAILGLLIFTEYQRVFSGVPGLSPYAATQLLNDNEAVFIDIRDEKEFKTGHIKGARSIPMSQLEQQMHDIEKHKDTDVVIYCDTGMRTSRATGKFKKAGFSKLSTIAGGLAQWEKANLPLVTK